MAQAFGDLPASQQKQLLDISRALTEAMRERLAGTILGSIDGLQT